MLKEKLPFVQKKIFEIVVPTLQGLYVGDHINVDDDIMYLEEKMEI
jgi:hypothetical protein